ncbi:energy transducer TonB [Thermodesulfovibrio thiophilus]|uniref:energy transducer TonB n=1 Tax=Thermodesulfovibrio thiophilus TaxID=340095 RepID=UPI000424F554|nr:energy transducer TonB [Thermodesulfovibrio thiophilus]
MHKIQFFILFSIFLHILFFIALLSFAYRVKDNSKIEVFIVTEFSTPVRENLNITKSLQKKQKNYYTQIQQKSNNTTDAKEINAEPSESIKSNTKSIKETCCAVSSSPVISRTSERSLRIESDNQSRSDNRIIDTTFGAVNGPQFIYRETPVYPKIARRLGKEGRVVLRLIINEHGKLIDIEVIEKAPYGFTESAIDAVKKSKFYPAIKDGKAVACKAILPVRFILK